MRISDWSSDVCSSDLSAGRIWPRRIHLRRRALQARDRELIFTSQGISMQTEQTTVNGIRITFEDKGPKEAPAILLVMGLGGQLTLWPAEFVDALNARGFRTIRYDNRDVKIGTASCRERGCQSS